MTRLDLKRSPWKTARIKEIFANFLKKTKTKTKTEYFRNLNIKDLNKKFSKKNPFYLDKGLETNNTIHKDYKYFEIKQFPPKCPLIPNLLIHCRDHMNIKNKRNLSRNFT